ncbi:xylulokinase [Christensenella tenuis]|jgi:xylulokinase|uniref:Xylulose kinase n=1 Tax=Christensenella tenuis TaxID=2763033 RepID=A0ABR7ECY8_9FIRM|nr:xylulokinase [Christensenella tenuis]MBC5647181.1 xylulokinase [Christensenella tenuis]
MLNYLIAHDLGTSGNKATLFSTEGELIKSVVYSYPAKFFNGNWAEQDPQDWWNAVCSATRELLQDIQKKAVRAISFSGQMMGCLCVDENGTPLRNAIIWADMRAEREENQLAEKIAPERFYQITGHKLSRSYSIEKLMWVKNNEPAIYAKTYKMLNAKDYIVYRLTGKFMTDYSDASSTNALDLNTMEWSDEIIAAAGVKRELFPDLKPSTYVAGEIRPDMEEESGLAAGTKIVLGGGDGSCASVGAGSIAEGITYNCLGSSSWISTVSKKPYYDGQMRTVTWAHVIPGLLIPSGTMQTAGAAFSWAKERFCQKEVQEAKKQEISPYDIINREIEDSPAGANALLFLPYLMGERCPRWNSHARGSFVGLKMEHTTGDLMRSVVEGVAMNLNLIIEILKNAVEMKQMIVVGGMAQGEVERQIFADVYGMDIVRLEHLEEATSIGAAVIAGVGAGELQGFEEVRFFNKACLPQKPIAQNAEIYQKMKRLFEKAYKTQMKLFEELARF